MAALPLPPPADNWRDHAACNGLDTNIFFTPRKGVANPFAEAKAICATCPVRDACLTDALNREPPSSDNGFTSRYGVWGGLTPDERKALARERAATCQRCDETIDRKPRSNTLYCPPCRAIRRREARNASYYRKDERTHAEPPAEPTRRARLESRADGNTGALITGQGHIPLPGETT